MINKLKSKYLQSNAFSLFSLPSTGIKTLNVDMFLFPNERRNYNCGNRTDIAVDILMHVTPQDSATAVKFRVTLAICRSGILLNEHYFWNRQQELQKLRT